MLPIFERLHKEIKAKAKEISSGVGKASKEVEKARNTTQKHIELLGTHTAAFDTSAHRISAHDDPYVIRRGVLHRLNKQVMEENNHTRDIIAVQNNFEAFEAHIVEVIQQGLASFNQFVGGQAQKTQHVYADMLSTAQRIPPDFEWKNFVSRDGDKLVDPSTADRKADNINFANDGHRATKPLIEGTLERKSRNKLSMSGYSTGYYVVTPSKYLHEFKDNDNYRKDPVPELSIYLPEATVGAVSGEKFNIKGKDSSGGMGAKLSGHAELSFKAHTAGDAATWHEVISKLAGSAPGALNTDVGAAGAGSAGATPSSAGGQKAGITPTSAGGVAPNSAGGQAPGSAPVSAGGHVPGAAPAGAGGQVGGVPSASGGQAADFAPGAAGGQAGGVPPAVGGQTTGVAPGAAGGVPPVGAGGAPYEKK